MLCLSNPEKYCDPNRVFTVKLQKATTNLIPPPSESGSFLFSLVTKIYSRPSRRLLDGYVMKTEHTCAKFQVDVSTPPPMITSEYSVHDGSKTRFITSIENLMYEIPERYCISSSSRISRSNSTHPPHFPSHTLFGCCSY